MFAIPLVAAVATSAPAWAIAGAALGAVGGLTGNRDLQRIGMLTGLAGGVYSALSGAAAAPAAAAGLGDAAAGATGVAAEAGLGAALNPTAVLGGADVAGAMVAPAGGAVAGIGSAVPGAENLAWAQQIAGPTSVAFDPTQDALGLFSSAADAAPSMAQQITGSVALNPARDWMGAFVGTGQPATAASRGLIGDAMDWAGRNPMSAAIIGRGAMDFVARGLTPVPDAERVRLQQRIAEEDMAERARVRRARAHVPELGFSPNPNASVFPPGGYQVPVRGIISHQMA